MFADQSRQAHLVRVSISFYSFMVSRERHRCIYFSKCKLEVFKNFKKLKSLIEEESGMVIKAIRSDCGREFTSNEFQKYFEDHRILRLLSIPKSLQQNGVARTKSKTILDMTRSMLKCKKLPNDFWAEAVACAVVCPKTLIL